MSSKREKQRVWPAAGVLAVSASVHVALLFVPLPGPRHVTAGPEPSSLRVELVARPSPAPEETPSPTEPPEPVSLDPAEPDLPTSTERAERVETPSSEPTTESTSPAPAAQTTEPASKTIRAQLLGAARKLGHDKEQPVAGEGLGYQGVPELPSQPGWLHQYTGRVSTSVDQWRSNDGSQNARVVTGSGQVVCVRTRAPTTAEIFNPWMSSALPMMSFCGREKPEEVEGADPWLRLPDSGR